MALKINDLIVTDIWEVSAFDPITGSPRFRLANCNSVEISHSSTTQKITAGRGARTIAVVSSEGELNMNISSATIDLNLLALQSGDADGIIGTEVEVPASEKITIPSATAYTVTLKGTPTADSIVSVLLDDGTPLVEGETAGEGKFTILTNTLTFDASVAGKSGVVFYTKKVSEAVDITIDSASPIQYVTIKADASFQDTCSGLNYLGYIVIPRAGVDKNFTLSASKSVNADGAAHNVIFNSIASCGETLLGRIFIYDESV